MGTLSGEATLPPFSFLHPFEILNEGICTNSFLSALHKCIFLRVDPILNYSFEWAKKSGRANRMSQMSLSFNTVHRKIVNTYVYTRSSKCESKDGVLMSCILSIDNTGTQRQTMYDLTDLVPVSLNFLSLRFS